MNLVLLRHGESEWNLENRFTGWTDVELSETGKKEAEEAGNILKDSGYDFDICYTSYLKRAIHTLNITLKQMDREWLPVIKSWELNERHYGALQGLNKSETACKYGEDQVIVWRRSFDVRPPLLDFDDSRNPVLQEQYRRVDKKLLPLAESLNDTFSRTIPYFENEIHPLIKNSEHVLITAHGNSLRALMMFIEKLSKEEVMTLNLPTGVPLVYEFDDDFNVLKKMFLGDPEIIAKRIKKVAAQGKPISCELPVQL